MSELNINDLSDEQLQDLAERLFPLLRQKISMRAGESKFGSRVGGFADMNEIEIETRAGNVSLPNPLGRPISGYYISRGDTESHCPLVEDSGKTLTFNTEKIGPGKKVRIRVY